MVGRKQFDVEEVLVKAVRVFWEQGYSGTSLSDLMHATGLGKASLYATFGNKQELFLRCLDHYVITVGRAQTAMQNSRGGLRFTILAGFDAVLDRMEQPGMPAGCLLAQSSAEAPALDPPITKAVAAHVEREIRQMRHLLESHLTGDVEGPELDSLALFLVTMAQALAVMHRAGVSVPRLRDMTHRTLDGLELPG